MEKYPLYLSKIMFTRFLSNKNAVIGLPMRLIVSIIIGTIALIAILSFILNPCLFPKKMIISIDPMINTLPEGENISEFDFNLTVSELDGHPITNAQVIIKGLGGIGSGSTDENGKVTIGITVELVEGQNENYLDVSVKAPCHESFLQNDMIKIVRAL